MRSNKERVKSLFIVALLAIVLPYSIIEIYQQLSVGNFPRISSIIVFLYATLLLIGFFPRKKK